MRQVRWLCNNAASMPISDCQRTKERLIQSYSATGYNKSHIIFGGWNWCWNKPRAMHSGNQLCNRVIELWTSLSREGILLWILSQMLWQKRRDIVGPVALFTQEAVPYCTFYDCISIEYSGWYTGGIYLRCSWKRRTSESIRCVCFFDHLKQRGKRLKFTEV